MEKDSNRFGFSKLVTLSSSYWMEKDSNLRRRCQQIYSLPPLATRESIHNKLLLKEADDRTRTDNLLITNQLLCQLSHIGTSLNWLLDGEGLEPLWF